jgi:hypothetical protein
LSLLVWPATFTNTLPRQLPPADFDVADFDVADFDVADFDVADFDVAATTGFLEALPV